MPRNIELKARIASIEAARTVAEKLATGRPGLLHQIDTYFHASHGRLKLRQIDGHAAELMAYDRSDHAQARASDYQVVPVANPDSLKLALTAALGIRGVIDKTREVFLYHNVRIHLDEVQSLGVFLEFEAVLGGKIDDAAGHAQLAWLCDQFGVSNADVLAESYADLLSTK